MLRGRAVVRVRRRAVERKVEGCILRVCRWSCGGYVEVNRESDQLGEKLVGAKFETSSIA